MPNSEQTVNINFTQGLNTKTDPWQLPVGQFLSLENSVFQKGGLLSKRNGYGYLAGTPPVSAFLTTYKSNLLAVGETVSAYSPTTKSWVTKGSLQPAEVSVLPLIRNNLTQTQTDAAVANGLICTVLTQTYTTVAGVVTNYLYTVQNKETGQNIVRETAIPSLGTINGSSRVFVVGSQFVIVSPVSVTGTTFLQYVSIPLINPTYISAAQNTYPEAYVPISSNPGWDGAVANNTLVLAYNTTAGAQGIHITSLTAAKIAANGVSSVVHSFSNAAYIGAIVSVCVDTAVSPNIFYISFWNNATTNGYTCAVYLGFETITTQFTPQQVITTSSVVNVASAAQNGVCKVFSEVASNYSYDSTIPSHHIKGVGVSQAGVVGTPGVIIRSVGLASKAFIVDESIYFLSAFQSPFQPSFFLINGTLSSAATPIITAKLAYQNGAGYLSLGLPGVTVDETTGYVAYLFKQSVEALNTLNNSQQTTAGGIYSQLGINLASFTIGTTNVTAAEIGQNLHISGGYIGMFDGYYPVEHNFFLFPDSVKCTWLADSTVTPTGDTTNGSAVITSVSSTAAVWPGMTITGTNIPANSTVLYKTSNTITISAAATGSAVGTTFTIRGTIAAKPDGSTLTDAYYYQVTYEWTDMQGNAHTSAPSIPVAVTTSGVASTGSITISIPTIRLTSKVITPVKLVVYRWSVQTQVYNQVTSITAPLLNDTTADSVSFVDVLPDAQVIGNNIIYTTGGVAPNSSAPGSVIITSFDTRLWVVDAEDPNLLWISKTVVEAVPVEFSSLFTIFVAPNIGTVASSGPVTAIAPMDDKLIVFKKNAIFYITGTGPDNLGTTAPGCPLGSYSQPTFITSVVGCVNQQSIVLTQDGLMFQSDKGIWLLNRSLQTTYIGAPVEAFNESIVNSANVIPGTNYVLFTLDTGEMLMYDYYYQQWGTFKGTPTTSSCIYNGLHTVLNSYGQIVQETPGLYLDGSNPVLLNFTTSWLNLASLQGYERFYEFYILAKYLSPHKLSLKVAYDYNDSIYHETLISPNNFSGSTTSPFGIPVPFGAPDQIEQWRVHAKKQLCQSFQLSLSEVFDSSFGTKPGAGFTMSGLNCRVGLKKAQRPIAARTTVG